MNRPLLQSPLLAVLLGIFVASCTPEEPTINSFDDRWRLLASDGASLSLYAMPDGSTQRTDVWVGGSSANIVEFRDQLYVMPTTDPWIVILDRTTLLALDTINMDTLGTVSDIAFANATTAYAVHTDKNLVSVIDITTNQTVRTIQVGDGAHSIAALGNQLAVACSRANIVQIIDSRTNVVEASIGVPEVPYYVRASIATTEFVVVSLGTGKLDAAAQSSPKISFVNASTRELIGGVELSFRVADALEQFPKGLVVTSSGFAYVPVQSGVLRVNARQRNKATLVIRSSFSNIGYSPSRAEVMLLREDEPVVEVWDEVAANQKAKVIMRANPGAFIALPR
ncbi:MAG: hypothetical protein SGJ05_12505 [bacterium]|nr:hypothetical protein [bacterium]